MPAQVYYLARTYGRAVCPAEVFADKFTLQQVAFWLDSLGPAFGSLQVLPTRLVEYSLSTVVLHFLRFIGSPFSLKADR